MNWLIDWESVSESPGERAGWKANVLSRCNVESQFDMVEKVEKWQIMKRMNTQKRPTERKCKTKKTIGRTSPCSKFK